MILLRNYFYFDLGWFTPYIYCNFLSQFLSNRMGYWLGTISILIILSFLILIKGLGAAIQLFMF